MTLAEASSAQGSWGDDGTIVFIHDEGGGVGQSALFRIPAGGGTPERLTTLDPDRGELRHGWPCVLPGGKAIVFSIARGDGVFEIALLSLETGEWETLVEQGYKPRYAASGHLVYALSGILMATPFDLNRLEITGPTVPILEDVAGSVVFGSVSYNLAPEGSLVYVAGTAFRSTRTLVWVDRNGREVALAAEPRNYTYPRVSPDGTRVALDVRDEENDIWIWDFARETLTRLTFDAGADQYPVWTPDSERVVFSSRRSGVPNLYWQSADGTGTAEQLTQSPNQLHPNSMSPDGKHVVFRSNVQDLGMLSLEGERPTQLLLSEEFREQNGEIAPDGRWLAYESNASGQGEIYVRPFPDVDAGRWQISSNGGTRPLWGPDGRELFYLATDNRLMAVPVETGENFTPGTPERLLDKAYRAEAPGRTYDIAPDGQRFLMIQQPESTEAGPTSITIVLNWFEELKQRVPPR